MESALQGDCRRKRREIHRTALSFLLLHSLSGASVEERDSEAQYLAFCGPYPGQFAF